MKFHTVFVNINLKSDQTSKNISPFLLSSCEKFLKISMRKFALLAKNLIPLVPSHTDIKNECSFLTWYLLKVWRFFWRNHTHKKMFKKRNFIPKNYFIAKFPLNVGILFMLWANKRRERQDVELGMEHKSNKEPLPAIQTLPFFSFLQNK